MNENGSVRMYIQLLWQVVYTIRVDGERSGCGHLDTTVTVYNRTSEQLPFANGRRGVSLERNCRDWAISGTI